LRARPDFPAPAALAAGDGPAVRDAFKRATDARASWLACSAAFCAAILDSIGESNRLAIADPDTDTLHLSPRDIINAMTALHGTMTGAEVDALRLPLKRKLAALADLPAHIVLFRGHLARLNTAGQAPLDLDAYRLFLASLSPFPDPSLVTSKGTEKGRARMMAWEGTKYTQLTPHHLTPHTLLQMLCSPFTLPNNSTLLNNSYHPPPGLGFNPYPHPMANGYYPYPPPAVAPAPAPSAPDKKGNRQKGIKKDKKGQTQPKGERGTPNTNLPRTSMSRPSKLHYYCHFHGWVTTHGWPSGNGGHHGDACQFMKSHPSEFTPPMLAARTPDAVPNHPGSTNVQRSANVPPSHCVPCFPPLVSVRPSLYPTTMPTSPVVTGPPHTPGLPLHPSHQP